MKSSIKAAGITMLSLSAFFAGCGGEEKASKHEGHEHQAGTSDKKPVEQPGRDVTFPSERIVGMLKSRPAGSADGWKSIGDAQGTMKVPVDHEALLDLTGYGVADISFFSTMKPGDVQELILERCNITDDKLGGLATLGLKGLNLNGNPITDAGLAALAGATSIEKLSLGDTNITDAGLVHLAGLTNLQKLWLQKTPITDAGLSNLSNLHALEFLVLYDTAITDAGIDAIKSLPKLSKVGLRGTKITNASLPKLTELPALDEVDVTSTAVTREETEKIKTTHPQLKFAFDSVQ